MKTVMEEEDYTLLKEHTHTHTHTQSQDAHSETDPSIRPIALAFIQAHT